MSFIKNSDFSEILVFEAGEREERKINERENLEIWLNVCFRVPGVHCHAIVFTHDMK